MSRRRMEQYDKVNPSRRAFIRKAGMAAAGLMVAPYLRSSGLLAYNHSSAASYLAQVAIASTTGTPADSYTYDDTSGGVKQKVQSLFDLLNQSGVITSLLSKGKKVVIKVNCVGGSGSASSSMLKGYSIFEAMWTHPAVVKAVVQLAVDAGVNASDITIVESLWSSDSFSGSFFADYAAIATALGCNVADISSGTFADLSTGSNYFNFTSLSMNTILRDADVYVSIPKLKHHTDAALSCALKNQIGSVPLSSYTTTGVTYRRQAIHSPTNGSSASFLPRAICDLNLARPVNLAVVDGIRNSKGGEGVWNSTFYPYQSHVLLAGLDAVATDSIAATVMGLDCEAATLPLPAKNSYGDTTCDNYMYLLNAKGVGTNQKNQIEILGDSSVLSAVKDLNPAQPTEFKLCANFPNPFNPSTAIVFFVPRSEYVRITVHDITGRAVETLVDGEVPAGEHRMQWSAQGLASGVYFCTVRTKSASRTIKMMYTK